MNDKEFYKILEQIRKYLEQEKSFVENPARMKDAARAVEIIDELFPNAVRGIKDDALQTGALVLSVDSNDMVVRGDEELEKFAELMDLIDNFEIYSTKGTQIHFAAVMQKVFILQKGK